MKTKWLIAGFVGLALGWGWYGGQQVKKREYDCQVRFDPFCFLWEKSDYGKAQDNVTDHMNKDIKAAGGDGN